MSQKEDNFCDNRQAEINKVRDILEEIGLQFANGVAVALVDKGVRTKNGFYSSYDCEEDKDIVKLADYEEKCVD